VVAPAPQSAGRCLEIDAAQRLGAVTVGDLLESDDDPAAGGARLRDRQRPAVGLVGQRGSRHEAARVVGEALDLDGTLDAVRRRDEADDQSIPGLAGAGH
jgi:hypothetical protein